MTRFTELGTESAVYRLDEFEGVTPIHAPARAKSRFADEYDVSYDDCRATVVEVEGQKYVLVGEVP